LRDSLSLGNVIWDSPFYSFGNRKEMVFGHDDARTMTVAVEFEDQGKSSIVNMSHQVVDRSKPIVEFEYTPLEGSGGGKWSMPSQTKWSESILTELRKVWFVGPLRRKVPLSEPVGQGLQQGFQPFDPDGRTIVSYLLGRWSDQDPGWKVAEEWLRRIDPQLKILKAPVSGASVSLETTRTQGRLTADINVSNQGAGIQNAMSIVSALVFSPVGSTIVIEEPEAHLHPDAQQSLVDLANFAVNKWNKQVVLITHSWDILYPYRLDIEKGPGREKPHVKADALKFTLVVFSLEKGGVEIKNKEVTYANKVLSQT
jgi:hypothetical protein